MREMIHFDPHLLRAADYAHPREVADDLSLSITERRLILSAWASDACAVDSRPQFRWLPGTPGPVALTKILDALKSLDGPGGNPAFLCVGAGRSAGGGHSAH
jgi:hypothetical protein